MIRNVNEDVTIDRAGIEEILKLHLEKSESIDRETTRVSFDVGVETHGQGYGEYDTTVLKSAEVETTTPTAPQDVLKILGRRTFRFGTDEITGIVRDYVAVARGVDPGKVAVTMKLVDRHMGDRGGYEGPYVTGAVAVITLD